MLLEMRRPGEIQLRIFKKNLLLILFGTWVRTWQRSRSYAEFPAEGCRHLHRLLMIQESGNRLQELGQDPEFGNCPEIAWERAENPHRLEIVFRSWVRIWRLGCWMRKFQHTLDWEPVD